jgi:hypothetical protein
MNEIQPYRVANLSTVEDKLQTAENADQLILCKPEIGQAREKLIGAIHTLKISRHEFFCAFYAYKLHFSAQYG